MKIIEWNSVSDIRVQFCDEYQTVVHTSYSSFKKSKVKNPYDKSVFGIGCIGAGPYLTKINQKHPIEYLAWISLLQRCYVEKWSHMFPAYFGRCSVCDAWFVYQNFAEWYLTHKYCVNERLHLDKDILVPGNTLYSPSTCLLVPQKINMFFKQGKPKQDGLPCGVTQCRGGYKAIYNTVNLGVYRTVNDAVSAHRTAWQQALLETLKGYADVMPKDVYQAVMVAAQRKGD